jgi:hypothetical protein
LAPLSLVMIILHMGRSSRALRVRVKNILTCGRARRIGLIAPTKHAAANQAPSCGAEFAGLAGPARYAYAERLLLNTEAYDILFAHAQKSFCEESILAWLDLTALTRATQDLMDASEDVDQAEVSSMCMCVRL